MRWILGAILFLGLAMIGSYIFIKGYPYRLYSQWLEGKGWNKYYFIRGYRPFYLRPSPGPEISPYQEDYAQLWRDFPIKNVQIPLPTRHPLFQTIPIVEFAGKQKEPQLGMVILNPQGREISRIYTLPLGLIRDESLGQDLFKLPFVRNRILKFPIEKLWKDIFTFEIQKKSKTLDEMIYDLYLLHLRSKILPKESLSYGLIKQERALIELQSQDKDYIVELIMTYNGGNIYSYILRTRKNSDESRKLRSKFMENISFNPIDTAMGNLLYTEFKQLNFTRQVDQEGMLYLFSAWSQDTRQTSFLKDMIFYLERGRNNHLQLKPLYQYAFKKYGKTFSTKKIFSDHDDPNLVLQRKTEIEAYERSLAAERIKLETPEEVELTPDEKMDYYLKKAKESGSREKRDMIVH